MRWIEGSIRLRRWSIAGILPARMGVIADDGGVAHPPEAPPKAFALVGRSPIIAGDAAGEGIGSIRPKGTVVTSLPWAGEEDSGNFGNLEELEPRSRAISRGLRLDDRGIYGTDQSKA